MSNDLTTMAKFYPYSLRNVILIAMEKPTATHVAGFHAWRKVGRFVKKGEKGILIIAPVVRRHETYEAQEPETTEEHSAVAFRGAYVFEHHPDGRTATSHRESRPHPADCQPCPRHHQHGSQDHLVRLSWRRATCYFALLCFVSTCVRLE
ncbi:MAG: ssDNA-binding domain-containing protein [Acidobacteria bacterium]|nr:ssDNA-binding domain-containing protein [Acidobacteriota bacterium]